MRNVRTRGSDPEAGRVDGRGAGGSKKALTGSVSDVIVQRVLVRQGVNCDLISILLDDVAASIAHFDKHAVSWR